MRSCWCLGCMDSLCVGTLEWGQIHTVHNCVLACDVSGGHKIESGTDLVSNMYSFEQMNCSKTAGPEVAAVVRKSTRDRNTAASELAVGDFVLFDAHDDEDEPIWLGRVIPNPEQNGKGVYKNKEGKNVKFNNVSIGRGKVAIYVT